VDDEPIAQARRRDRSDKKAPDWDADPLGRFIEVEKHCRLGFTWGWDSRDSHRLTFTNGGTARSSGFVTMVSRTQVKGSIRTGLQSTTSRGSHSFAKEEIRARSVERAGVAGEENRWVQ